MIALILCSLLVTHVNAAPGSIYGIEATHISGDAFDMGGLKNKAVLFVNVASRCGFTNNHYMELTHMYNKYKESGLEIVAVPCNQFGSQEPASNKKIQVFATDTYAATFPLLEKTDVNGPTSHPLFASLKSMAAEVLGVEAGGDVEWNFEKFLIDHNGALVMRYESKVSPFELEDDIREVLKLQNEL